MIELETINLDQPKEESDSINGSGKGEQVEFQSLLPSPLLLLQYQSFWLGDQEVEHVPEDNRSSEYEVSGHSEFNSCASEVELPPFSVDELDPLELFQDAIDRIDS